MPIPDLNLNGIALAPVIVALIALAKRAGMPPKYAPYANGALSILAYAVVVWLTRDPALVEPAGYVLNILLIFLTAAGVYDRTQRILPFSK